MKTTVFEYKGFWYEIDIPNPDQLPEHIIIEDEVCHVGPWETSKMRPDGLTPTGKTMSSLLKISNWANIPVARSFDKQLFSVETELTEQKVRKEYSVCLATEIDSVDGIYTVNAEGITARFSLSMLNMSGSDINAMLVEVGIPQKGAPLSKWMFTTSGHRWTSSERTARKLILMGMGIGSVNCPVPEKLWQYLPNEKPVFRIL